MRSIRGWVHKKHPELHGRNALKAAILSGDLGELREAVQLARAECVAWKGGKAMSHDEMSSKLHAYLTAPFPKRRGSGEEVVVTPSTMAQSLQSNTMADAIRREASKYARTTEKTQDQRNMQDAHRGKSQNERAQLARDRLRDIQKKAENDRRGAAAEDEGSEDGVATGMKAIGGRYDNADFG